VSGTEDWEGARRPRASRWWLLVVVAVAGAAGALLGSGAAAPAPDALVVQETEAPPPTELPSSDPAVAGVWRPIRSAPLRGRVNAATAWTGADVVVWGGFGRRAYTDGALYNPDRDRWRMLPPGPLSPRARAATAVSGDTVVIAGGTGPPIPRRFILGAARRDAAAYDLVADRWTRLPDLPFALGEGRLFAVGGRVYAVSRSLRERPVAVLEHGSAMWRLLPPAPVATGAPAATGLAGNDLLLWPTGGGSAAALDVSTGRWRHLGEAPASVSLRDCTCSLVAGATPNGGVAVAAHDPAGDRWWPHAVDPLQPSYIATTEPVLYLVGATGSVVALDRRTGSRVPMPKPPQNVAFQAVQQWTSAGLFLWSGVSPLKFRNSADGVMFVPAR
jgi:hypothetical protein